MSTKSPEFHGVLPDWPPGTVTILATAGDGPHAIPVSAAVRAGPRRALIGLAASRGSLARLRADPRVSLAIVGKDVAVTAYGRARVIEGDAMPEGEGDAMPEGEGDAMPEGEGDAMPEGVVAVEIEVERVQDHDRPTFAIEAGVQWRWTDPDASRRDAEVRAALAALAGRRSGDAG